VTRWLVLLGIVAAGGLIVGDLVDYMPGRQTYWDARIRELCEKDGGVAILDRVSVAKGDSTAIAVKALADPKAPVYAETRSTTIREGNPSVWRSEWQVVRRSDQAIVARAIQYSRAGGDFPTVANATWFGCPDNDRMKASLEKLFVVQE
jgi:hypothetical protein